MGASQAGEGPMTTVWIYVDTNKEVGDVDHLKVFASEEAAEKWFAENDHPVPPKGGPTTQGYHLCRASQAAEKAWVKGNRGRNHNETETGDVCSDVLSGLPCGYGT
jgi:hypothetical protein